MEQIQFFLASHSALKEILQAIVLVIGFPVALNLWIMAYKIFKNRNDFDENRQALIDYNAGVSRSQMSYDRRLRINPGIAVNIKTREWVLHGEISDCGIDSVLD